MWVIPGGGLRMPTETKTSYSRRGQLVYRELPLTRYNNYFLATGQTFVLLHGLTKKTGPVPRTDTEMAESRRDDYLSRRR